MTDLRYPMKENTVPIWAVPVRFFPQSTKTSRYLFVIIAKQLKTYCIIKLQFMRVCVCVCVMFLI